MTRLGSSFLQLEDRLTPTSFTLIVVVMNTPAPDPAPQTREHVLLARQVGVTIPGADAAAHKHIGNVKYDPAAW